MPSAPPQVYVPNYLSRTGMRFLPSVAYGNSQRHLEAVMKRISLIEEFTMPAKYTKPAGKKQDWEVEFISIPLLSDVKEAFEAWASEAQADVEVWIAQLLGMGYKLSMTLDVSNNCVIVTATCKEEKSPNKGYAVSSRSDSWLEALMITIYKTLILHPEKDGGWPKTTRNDSWG